MINIDIHISMIQKQITITKKQEKWIKENHINLSGLVREKLREEINE